MVCRLLFVVHAKPPWRLGSAISDSAVGLSLFMLIQASICSTVVLIVVWPRSQLGNHIEILCGMYCCRREVNAQTRQPLVCKAAPEANAPGLRALGNENAHHMHHAEPS